MDCELREVDWRFHGESNRSFGLERAKQSSRRRRGSMNRSVRRVVMGVAGLAVLR